MTTRFFSLIAFVCFFLFGSVAVLAQGERATITGTVTDSTQAIVPDTRITVRNLDTNVEERTVTNSSGIYYVPALPPGRYEVAAEKSGFRAAKVENLPLTVGLTATVNMILEVGTVSEAVEVNATAVQLEAQTSGLGKVVQTRQILELPNLGRDPFQYSALAPGVIPSSGQVGVGGDAIGSARNARISGGLAMQNGILVDGGESRGTTSSGQTYTPPLESVAEFKVETATYSPQFGRAAGGVINVATKSGTNQFHGSGYEYLRNDHLNANNWTNNLNGIPKGLYQWNQFGATIGGPVVHNRTFFFFNYQGKREGSPYQFLDTVPSTLQRQGDFSQTFDRFGRLDVIYDPQTTRPDPAHSGSLIRDPFPGNKIPSDRVDPIAAKVLPFWPDANRPGEGPSLINNFFISGKTILPTNAYFARVDHMINAKHRLYGRFGAQQARGYSTGLKSIAFPATTIDSDPTRSALISETSSFSPTMLGEFRLSYTRIQNNSYPLSEGFNMASLGFGPNLTSNVFYKQFPDIYVQTYASGTGLTVTGASPNEVGQLGGAHKVLTPQDTWQAQYHFTWIKARHSIRMGADLQLIKMNAYNSQYSAGQYAFDRTYTQGPDPNQSTLNGGNGMATMLLGLPIAGALTISNRLFLYNKYYGFYVADDFHVNKKLTLNLGLRYEYTTPYAEKFGNLSYFDFNGTEPLTGRKGVLKFIKPGGYQSDPKRLNFSPRVGFAYQLNSKTVIRSAGAIFYAANNGLNNAATDFGTGGFTSNFLYLGQTNPLGASTPPIGGSWENPFAAGITGIDKTSSFAGRAVRADTRNHPLAYVSNWTLSIQRMVTSTLMVEGAYVGSKITHLFWNRQNNQDSPLLLPLGNQLLQPVANPFIGQIKTGALSGPTITLRQALRPYPQYLDVLIFRDPYGDSEYESATLRVEKQYARGLTFSAGYTFSKAIASTGESNTWVVGPSNALYNPKYNRSLEANDLTHRLVLSYVWDTPIGIGKPYLSHGVVGRVLGNWEVTGITVIQGGRPILITAPDNTHLLNFSYTNGRANRLHDPVLSHGQGTQEWFDTTAFAEAPAFTVPNDSLSQPHLRGPGLVSFNVGAFKNIPFKERLNFQFRAEFFNIFNHPALEVRYSSTDVTSSQFGQIVSGGGERNIQLGVRVIF